MIPIVSLLLSTITALAFLALHRRHKLHLSILQYQCTSPRTHWTKDIFFGIDFMTELHTNIPMMKRNHDRFGQTYQLNSLFGDPVINTIAPENLALIHSDGKSYGVQPVRLPPMELFCGRGFLTTDGAEWSHARKMLRPSFAKPNIANLEFLARETDKLISKIPVDGATFDLQPLLFITFLHSSLHFLLGIDASENSDNAPCTSEQFIESFHSAVSGTGLRLMLGRFKSLAPRASYIKACTRVHEYIDHYIQQSLKDPSSLKRSPPETPTPQQQQHQQRSVIQGLAAQTHDPSFIRSQTIQGMLAAQETISVLVSNTIFHLSRHPSEWQKLRTAVLNHGASLFEFHNLSAFRPMQNILKEGMYV